jgi:phosphonopyruvate decarboxylase
MIEAKEILNFFISKKVKNYIGVPDSLLSTLSINIKKNHIISSNEGNAIAIAIGTYMASSKPSVVYLQNSGIGNLLNPLVSLADKEVYSFPIFMIIGWRGKPGVQDEPQHIKQGKITTQLLDILNVPYKLLIKNEKPERILNELWSIMIQESKPVAILIEENSIASQEVQNHFSKNQYNTREQMIQTIVDNTDINDIFVATTGKTGRELFEIRNKTDDESCDFLTVGGMGHASSIALGLAIEKQNKHIFCLDGDGALLMHMGALATIGKVSPKNLIHILLNNFSHDSVGGQPTGSENINFELLVKACGYQSYQKILKSETLVSLLSNIKEKKGPHFIEIFISPGSRKDLGRPNIKPIDNKINFMTNLNK